MTTYPLSTLAAQVTPAGISSPSYEDILNSLKASYQSIFGSDVYLENDSQDGQLLAVFALAIYDCNATAVAVYNSFSPSSAQGTGLSSNVKINGLARLVPSNSTATVTIVGQAGTVIEGGVVADTGGNKWSLPASVTIPVGGEIDVTVTAQEEGAVSAAAGTITQINTPTRGWQSVTNAAAAVAGAPVETDAALRRRQSYSTALPSQSILAGIVGAVANVSGVQLLKAYENDTTSTDANGIPAHSISVVVQGGDASAIATAIANKKPPGTGTHGTTTETIIDANGVPSDISFYAPTQVPIDVNITISAKTGYVSTTGDLIVANLTEYLNGVGIGGVEGKIYNAKLYYPADNTGALTNTYNITALTARRDSASFATTDISIAFNELPYADTITLTVV